MTPLGEFLFYKEIEMKKMFFIFGEHKKREAVVIYAAIADTFPSLCSSIEIPGYQQANLSCCSLFRTAVRACNK